MDRVPVGLVMVAALPRTASHTLAPLTGDKTRTLDSVVTGGGLGRWLGEQGNQRGAHNLG